MQNSSPVSVLMVGIGGYGHYYLETLLEEFPEGMVRLAGVVDPYADRSEYYPFLKHGKIPVYAETEEFYKRETPVDLAVISSPIHYHVHQSITALENGSNVLCDKPVAAVVQDVDKLIRVRNQADRWVMVGYQWSYSNAIQSLKRDILSGRFGKPLHAKSICLWPRDDAYYSRNSWAGRIRDDRGNWILDSPANNGMAHFLHNLLYLLGDRIDSSAIPTEVCAELYRVNPIENYDTVAARVRTQSGVELCFYASHATEQNTDPQFHIEFENASVEYNNPGKGITVKEKSGTSINYGSPEDDPQFKKLFVAVENIRNPTVLSCGPEAARSQTVCIDGFQLSMPDVSSFPGEFAERDDKCDRWWVKGLDEALISCYKHSKLPSELGSKWAKQGKWIDLRNFREFTG